MEQCSTSSGTGAFNILRLQAVLFTESRLVGILRTGEATSAVRMGASGWRWSHEGTSHHPHAGEATSAVRMT